jgi:hypothetical protein
MTWETPGRSPIAGLRDGREELQYVTADGQGRVVGVHRNTGSREGRTLDTMCCITFEVRDGKIVSGREHFFDLYDWDQYSGHSDGAPALPGGGPGVTVRPHRLEPHTHDVSEVASRGGTTR